MVNIFISQKPFTLESGRVLPSIHLAYTTYGELNNTKSNVVWIFHALTANSNAAEWWPGLVGTNKVFNPHQYFIICVNMPGSCYGSISPLDIDKSTGNPFYHDFPFFTTRDMIRSYQLLKDHLGIEHIHIGIGGSMGGQQLLEWAVEAPELFTNIIPLTTNAQHSPWGIAFNATQRHSIEADPSWLKREADAGLKGMSVARGIALLSYRNYHSYLNSQQESDHEKTDNFKSETYQQYQGLKLVQRFNAFSYYFLSKGMDAHHLGRNRKSAADALKSIKANALVISISSDILFPPEEQEFIAKHIYKSVYKQIDSAYGHDGFLLEYEQIANAIEHFIND